MDRYNDRLLPLFRQFLLIPNRNNMFMGLITNFSTACFNIYLNLFSVYVFLTVSFFVIFRYSALPVSHPLLCVLHDPSTLSSLSLSQADFESVCLLQTYQENTLLVTPCQSRSGQTGTVTRFSSRAIVFYCHYHSTSTPNLFIHDRRKIILAFDSVVKQHAYFS